MFLSAIHPNPDFSRDGGIFPWSLPLVRDFGEVEFRAAVTFPVGENGSGKLYARTRVTRTFLADPAAVLRKVLG